MEDKLFTRRNASVLALMVGASATTAACTGGTIDIGGLQQQLVDIITKVQQGVKNACSLVPTASSVLTVLRALAGSNPTIEAFLSATQGAIDFINKACPQSPQLRGSRGSGKVNDQEITVDFY